MDEFLKELADRIRIAKDGITRDSKDQEFDRPSFSKRPVMIRQLMGNEEEAKSFDLSTKEGVENTEAIFAKQNRINEWLTLSGKIIR